MGTPKLSDAAEPQAAPAPLNPTLLLPPEVNQTSKSKLSGPTEPEALPVPRDPHKLPMRPDVNQMSASKHLNPAEPEDLPENSDPLRPEVNQMGAPKPHKPAESQAPPVHRHPNTLPLRPEVNQMDRPELHKPAESQAPPVHSDPETLRSRREVNRMGAQKLSGPAETQVPPVHLNQGTLTFRPEVGQMGTPMLFKSPDVQLCVYDPLNTRQWVPGPSGDDWDQWDESDKPDEPDIHDRASMNPVMFWLLTLMNCVFTLRGVLSLLDFSVERLRRREREERKGKLASRHKCRQNTYRPADGAQYTAITRSQNNQLSCELKTVVIFFMFLVVSLCRFFLPTETFFCLGQMFGFSTKQPKPEATRFRSVSLPSITPTYLYGNPENRPKSTCSFNQKSQNRPSYSRLRSTTLRVATAGVGYHSVRLYRSVQQPQIRQECDVTP